jgi:uncharacterized membrane-anchored protein
MLSASLLGTTLGDFVSVSMGLGYVRGLPLMLGLLGAVLLAERGLRIKTQSYYWAAVVITRTGATNLADLGTHERKLGYAEVAGCLALLLAATLVARMRLGARLRMRTADAAVKAKELPATDLTYWMSMLVASMLGTTLGDGMSDGLHWSFGQASLALGGLLAVALYVRQKAHIRHEAYYWSLIVLVRTTGTTAGDFLSGDGGLNMGFGLAAGCTALLLVVVLVASHRPPVAVGSVAGVAPASGSRTG